MLVKGDRGHCKRQCVNKKWCKSFDFCYGQGESESFCHLKDVSMDVYRKDLHTEDKHSDYYECRNNGKVLTV